MRYACRADKHATPRAPRTSTELFGGRLKLGVRTKSGMGSTVDMELGRYEARASKNGGVTKVYASTKSKSNSLSRPLQKIARFVEDYALVDEMFEVNTDLVRWRLTR